MTGINYGSKEVKEIYYSSDEFATQGPCPDEYHVPTKDEWQAVYDAGVALGQWNDVDGNLISVKLKLPFAGLRRRSTAEALNQGSTGYYWSSTGYSTDSAHYLYFSSSEVLPQYPDNRVYGFSIRAFRNSPLTPDASWTTIYSGSNGSGIYHNPTEGVISISSNGTTWYTIADKNLGATAVYNDGDSLSQANCGYYYQWGNNYNFPRTGTVTTSSTKVDASSYGPGNYYSSSTFITGSSSAGDWSSVTNDNLWGGVTGSIYTLKKVKEVYYGSKKIRPGEFATQGPAPDGYHVPTKDDWQAVYNAGVALGQWSSSNGDGMRIKLKLPFAGYRNRASSNVGNQGSYGRYWSSTGYSTDHAYIVYFNSSSLNPQSGFNRAMGHSVRAFKNTPLKPSSSWTTIYAGNNGSGIYHNPTEGVISISSDGTNWITIADKNLGATTVYNDGDTLSQANCGNYYQWGNNYGFAWTGTVTTSDTQVDASAYGPGNYYSNNTFILKIYSPYDWSSVQNDNLWGGVTGNVPI